ncbi:efflux RND transporter periplasmic adaptor subunit, partial [Myroides odoratimimus]
IIYTLKNNQKSNQLETEVVAQQNAEVSVRTERVSMQKLNTQYVTNGILIPKQEVMISAEINGRIAKLLVEEGAFVQKGQILAVIEGDKQNTSLNKAQAVYDNALSDFNRYKTALVTGGVTQQQVDQISLQVENAKNDLANARILVSDSNVKASFSGIINKRSIEVGTYVSPGETLFEVVNVSALKLRVNVDEKNVNMLKVGQSVNVKLPVFADKDFVGKIRFIAPKADSDLNFPIEIEIENTNQHELKAGMYATAYIGDDQESTILTVPRAAFVGSVSSNQVFIVQDGKAVLKKAIAGRVYGDYVEIISGIEQGMDVITSGQINLVDSTPVKTVQ